MHLKVFVKGHSWPLEEIAHQVVRVMRRLASSFSTDINHSQPGFSLQHCLTNLSTSSHRPLLHPLLLFMLFSVYAQNLLELCPGSRGGTGPFDPNRFILTTPWTLFSPCVWECVYVQPRTKHHASAYQFISFHFSPFYFFLPHRGAQRFY